MTDAEEIAEALSLTPKGTVKYDSNWNQEGRGKAMLMHLGENLAILNVVPAVNFRDEDGIQRSDYVNESLYTFTPGSGNSPSMSGLSEYESDVGRSRPPRVNLTPEMIQTERAIEAYEWDRQMKVQENIEAWKKHLEHQLNIRFSHIQQKSNFLAKMRLEQQRHAEKLKHENEMRLKEIEEKKQQQLKEQHEIKAKLLSEKIRNAELQHKAQQEEIQRMKVQEKLREKLESYCKDIVVALEHAEQIILSNVSANEYLPNWKGQFSHILEQTDQLQQLQHLMEEDIQTAGMLKVDAHNLCKEISAVIAQAKASEEQHKNDVADFKSSTVDKKPDDQSRESKAEDIQDSGPPENTREKTEEDPEGALREYEDIIKFQRKVEGAYQSLVKDEKRKKYKFDLQKAVNTPVNAISAYSGAHLRDKFERLLALISGQTVEVGEKQINCKQHPQAIFYCMDLLAKKLVMQGEGQIASKFETAFPVAVVIVGLWCRFPEFGRLVLYHLYERCPYLLPYYPVEDDHKQRPLGHEELKRISGYVRLYAAIIQSSPPPGVNTSNPHGLKYGWRWIARVLNAEPRLDITATILFDFLESAGHAMQKTYGNQFQKLLHALCKDYFPRIKNLVPSGSGGGPFTRLEGLLQKVVRQRMISPPEGLLKPNFWNTF